MSDALLDHVDALVAALEAGDFSSAFEVQWKDDALAELADKELLATQVWVVDAGESVLPAWGSNASQAGCPIEELEELLIVQRKFTAKDDVPALVRELSELCSEIARFCRRTAILDTTCVKTIRSPARDLKDHNEKGRFYAEIRPTWHRVLDDE
jgi:hypothetical protein